MYSAEQRAKAIETFAKFGCSAADTIAELGYPSRVTLRNWWKEYQISGDEFLERRRRRPRYSDEEKRGAVDHYLEHGKSLARTIRAMGYPSREVLASWVDELAPGRRKYRGPNPKKGVLFVASKKLTKRHVAFEHYGRHVLHYFFALPSIKAASMRRLAPLNSTSLPWWTILSIMAEASLSSPRTVLHFESSMFVVNIMLRLS